MPQHFLVPVDFSADADQALTYAIDLARQLGARLTLLHVLYVLHMTEVDMTAYEADIEATARQELKTRLQRVRDAGVAGDMLLVHGAPFQHIIETARQRNVDLIIMGTHGRTGLQHVLVGSVAEKVVRLASCPVLVTRRNSPAPAA